MQRRSRSATPLLLTRRAGFGSHLAGAIPGYSGHVPGRRNEGATIATTFAKGTEVARVACSTPTFDVQELGATQKDQQRGARLSTSQPSRAPRYDRSGSDYPAAGDFNDTQRDSENVKKPCHSSMRLTSRTYDGLGGLGTLRGYGSAAGNIPGFTGHIPGKVVQNVHGGTWTKLNEQGIGEHFAARMAAPKEWSLCTKGGTLVSTVKTDAMKEIPIKSRSYADHIAGWSDCRYTGSMIGPAGRALGQESYGLAPQPPAGKQIHGYAGWVPGRVGESVVGERQCNTNHVADVLFNKARMRITQR